MYELRPYQTKAIQDTRQAFADGYNAPCLVLPTGSGKTLCAGAIISAAKNNGKRAVFVVHRQELARQTAKTLRGFGVEPAFIMAGKPEDPTNPVQIASIGTLKNRLNRHVEPDLIIFDECFVGNTKVRMADGTYKKIKHVRPGDKVLCATGIGTVSKTMAKEANKTYIVRLENGTKFEATGNHPVFTSYGWKRTKDLVVGNELVGIQDMPVLWKKIPTVESLCKIHFRKTEILQCILLQESKQSNEKYYVQGEDETNTVKNKAQASGARWKRLFNKTPDSLARNAWKRLANGICFADKNQTDRGVSYTLQDRHSKSIEKDCDRNRRSISLFATKTGARQKERTFSFGTRVASIQVSEQRRGRVVYNMAVDEHPSYFANDILVHNCQHVLANQWLFVRETWNKAKILGLTATPCRLDGKPLHKFFDTLVIGPTVADLIRLGALTPYDYYAPSIVDVSHMQSNRSDYTKDALSAFSMKREIIGDNIEQYKKLAMGKRNIVFACNVKHSLEIVNRYNDAGIPAAHLDGETPQDEREKTLERFARGEILVLSNVELFGEGFDLPAIEVVSLLRPTLSTSLHLQQVGRALRPCPELGKERAIILDHVGNYERHGMPDDVRQWSLKGGLLKRNTSAKSTEPTVRVQRCPDCFFAHKPAKSCPLCGHVYINENGVKEIAGELVLLGTQEHQDALKNEIKKVETYEELVKIEKERNYKTWWAENMWLRKTGIDLRQTVTGLNLIAKARGYSRGWSWLQAKRRGLL